MIYGTFRGTVQLRIRINLANFYSDNVSLSDVKTTVNTGPQLDKYEIIGNFDTIKNID